jgi:hypothetical protein
MQTVFIESTWAFDHHHGPLTREDWLEWTVVNDDSTHQWAVPQVEAIIVLAVSLAYRFNASTPTPFSPFQ